MPQDPVGMVVADVAARLQAVATELDNASELREVKHLEPAVVGALHDAYPNRGVARNRKHPIPSWSPVGNVDVVMHPETADDPLVAIELKWCHVDKLYEAIWDLFKWRSVDDVRVDVPRHGGAARGVGGRRRTRTIRRRRAFTRRPMQRPASLGTDAPGLGRSALGRIRQVSYFGTCADLDESHRARAGHGWLGTASGSRRRCRRRDDGVQRWMAVPAPGRRHPPSPGLLNGASADCRRRVGHNRAKQRRRSRRSAALRADRACSGRAGSS